jgi:hypothetical protein
MRWPARIRRLDRLIRGPVQIPTHLIINAAQRAPPRKRVPLASRLSYFRRYR